MAWTLPEDAVLGIFGEKPELAATGSRLAEEFGEDRTETFHEALLLDTIELWNSPETLGPGGRRVLVYGPSDAGPWFEYGPRAIRLSAPDGRRSGRANAGFPERRAGRCRQGRRHRCERAHTGSDDRRRAPFLCLEGRDLVIGPATDGGLLIGARREIPPLFEGIELGRPDVLAQVLDRLAHTGLSLSVLPPWYVVETSDHVRMLAGHLRALRRAGFDPGCRGWNG